MDGVSLTTTSLEGQHYATPFHFLRSPNRDTPVFNIGTFQRVEDTKQNTTCMNSGSQSHINSLQFLVTLQRNMHFSSRNHLASCTHAPRCLTHDPNFSMQLSSTNHQLAWWRSGLTRKTRNLVPSGASVRIRPTSHDDHQTLLFCLVY